MYTRLNVLLFSALLLLAMGCDSTGLDDVPIRTNLDAPALISPLNGKELSRSTGNVLTWNPVAGAISYTVMILDNNRPSEPPLTFTTANTNYTVLLDTAGSYTWKVCAQDRRGRVGYWSEQRTFSVE